MADERARLALYRRLDEVLGEEHTVTLMDEIVTKDYLRLQFAEFRAEFRGELHQAITTQTRTLLLGILGIAVAFAALVLGLT